MIKKLTITKVYINEKNKDGIPYSFKNGKYAGKPFSRVSVRFAETGEDMYSNNVMSGDRALALKEGDVVIFKLTEDNGFKNFKYLTKGEQEVYDSMATPESVEEPA